MRRILVKQSLLILCLILLGVTTLCYAGYSDIGEVSKRALAPVTGFSRFLIVVSYILGAGFLAGGLARFVEYRRNPIQTTLSSVLLIFFLGVLLVVIPLIASYSPSIRSVEGQQRTIQHEQPNVQQQQGQNQNAK